MRLHLKWKLLSTNEIVIEMSAETMMKSPQMVDKTHDS